jgi:phage shock protein A
MNNQNRTADGRIASKKEAQRTDCNEMVGRYHVQAKAALQRGERAVAKALVDKCANLRAAFFADYGERP